MDSEFVVPLLVNVAAFTVLYLYLLVMRRRLAEAERNRSVAGEADVAAPDLDRIVRG